MSYCVEILTAQDGEAHNQLKSRAPCAARICRRFKFLLKLTEISREGLTNWKIDFLNIWDIFKDTFFIFPELGKAWFHGSLEKILLWLVLKKTEPKKNIQRLNLFGSLVTRMSGSTFRRMTSHAVKNWRHALFKNDVTHGLSIRTHAVVLWGAPKNVFVMPPCVTWCSRFIGRSQELESLGLHWPSYAFKSPDGLIRKEK